MLLEGSREPPGPLLNGFGNRTTASPPGAPLYPFHQCWLEFHPPMSL
jgi:hypothetical protein